MEPKKLIREMCTVQCLRFQQQFLGTHVYSTPVRLSTGARVRLLLWLICFLEVKIFKYSCGTVHSSRR